MTQTDTDVKIYVNNDICIQKKDEDVDMSMSNIMIKITSQIWKLKDIQDQKCQILKNFADYLLKDDGVIQNLNLINKFCNSWYFRDQWGINNIIDGINSDNSRYAKITVLPSFGVFNKNSFQGQGHVGEHDVSTHREIHTRPGIYVYNFQGNEQFPNGIQLNYDGQTVSKVKPLVIYYIKGLRQVNTLYDNGYPYMHEFTSLMLCQNINNGQYYICYEFGELMTDQNDKVYGCNEEKLMIYGDVSRTITTEDQDDKYFQPVGRWTINKCYEWDGEYEMPELPDQQPSQKLKKLIIDSKAGDIIQWVRHNSSKVNSPYHTAYIFKLSNKDYVMYNVLIDPNTKELVTNMSLNQIQEPTVYELNDICISKEQI